MKKIIVLFLMIFSFALNAQKQDYDWKNMDPHKRKEAIEKLSPEERKALLMQFRNNMILENLEIDPKDKDEFLKVYNEYIENQKKIKNNFNPNFKVEQLTDQEAKIKLQQSFELGQQLLNNRKIYAEKMQQIISPQKVLKLFQAEGVMRNKMNERKQSFTDCTCCSHCSGCNGNNRARCYRS